MNWPALSIALGKAFPWVATTVFFAVGAVAILRRKSEHQRAVTTLKKAVQNDLAEPVTLHPEIDPAKCAGCGACVRACPEGEIIQMVGHKAVLVQPTKCVGHGECEASCPFSAITLVFGTKTRGMELPRISTNYETNVGGLYIAGELGGMGLIRNAVKQGRLAVAHASATLPRGVKTDTDLLIVGAGAAGLSASLAAIENKASYVCVEQGSFGGTIYNFPRQKVVMSHPAELPLFGTMRFPSNKVSKEELLAFWNEVRKRSHLRVNEGVRFMNLKRQGGVFTCETTKGTLTAKKVVLAMGLRGTPRRLNLPNEDMAKVTYNLIEPAQYQRKHVAVVGGGNVAVEAAQMLGKREYKNRVTLLVRGDKLDRCNEENQNIIMRMTKEGLVRIAWNTSVKAIEKHHIMVEREGKVIDLPNDYLFVCIGAELPFKFLTSLGIEIDKKFGEPQKP